MQQKLKRLHYPVILGLYRYIVARARVLSVVWLNHHDEDNLFVM